jgi:hypothetical protein
MNETLITQAVRIPIQFGHLFRFNSAGHSGEFGHP